MNREIKKRWVAALRSGKYRQSRDHLRKDDCYCALGVLCDLFVQDRQQEGVAWMSVLGHYAVHYKEGQSIYSYDFLPQPVMNWAGLTRENPAFFVYESDDHFTVSDLNDDQQLSFAEIATIIEESPDNDAYQ